MRRKDKEITDTHEILSLIKSCDVCRVAFFDEEFPYIVPLSFGVSCEDGEFRLYFHCASEGKKLDLIERNNRVAFEMDRVHETVLAETACDSGVIYGSVCGTGVIRVVEEGEKQQALETIMNHYQPEKTHQFSEDKTARTKALVLKVASLTAKGTLGQ